MKNLSVRKIERVIDNNEIDEKLRSIINIFLSSINDWPVDVLTLCEYEKEVESFIENNTTKKNIQKVLRKIDFSKNSWESESLTQILDVFQFYKEGLSLKEIIECLECKI